MRIQLWLTCLFFLVFSTLCGASEKAIVLDISGAIGPATADYVQRGIHFAEKEQAKIIVLQMNTPGGLDSSMRSINAAIIASAIPVVTFVYPSGSRAASAGVFIMTASHVAVMAPGTNVGAASPVNLLNPSAPSATAQVSTEDKKVMNDASAYIRSIAELRGRNTEWLEQAVRQAVSISASEALRLKVIDDVAGDYPQLLTQLDGRTVTMHGIPLKLATKNLELTYLHPDWRYQFLSFITDPNIAYLLLLAAMYGLFFEFSNPGMVLPGLAGVISLLLVLYAFQLMPINYVGVLLLLIGISCMLFEVFVSSFGVIGIAGAIAFIIGSVMLFDVHDGNYHVSWSLITSMSVMSLGFFVLILNVAVKSHKTKIITGQEGLIGSEGIVITQLDERMLVRVFGEIWEATATQPLAAGDKVKIIHVAGLRLIVTPLNSHKHTK